MLLDHLSWPHSWIHTLGSSLVIIIHCKSLSLFFKKQSLCHLAAQCNVILPVTHYHSHFAETAFQQSFVARILYCFSSEQASGFYLCLGIRHLNVSIIPLIRHTYGKDTDESQKQRFFFSFPLPGVTK